MSGGLEAELHRVALELKREQRNLANEQRQAKRATRQGEKSLAAARWALARKHSKTVAMRARIERLKTPRAEPVEIDGLALVVLFLGAGPPAVLVALILFSMWPG